MATESGVAVLLLLINPAFFFAGGRGAFGIGLKEGNLAALEFFRSEHLQGPIFNTFDVGSYLTYGLYPRERVYVDNRPEAYPATFFTEDYFPLLVNEEKWRSHLVTNKFNIIVVKPSGHPMRRKIKSFSAYSTGLGGGVFRQGNSYPCPPVRCQSAGHCQVRIAARSGAAKSPVREVLDQLTACARDG